MSAKPTHDLAIKRGEYRDGNGETRARWMRVGTVVRHDDGGTSVKLDAIPVGLPDWDGWISVFPRDRDSGDRNDGAGGRGASRGQSARQTGQDFDDDIPF